MKRILMTLCVLVLCLSSSGACADTQRPWGTLVPLPTQSQLDACQPATRAPYIVLSPEIPRGGFIEYAADFKADYLPGGTYACLLNWTFDVSSLKKQYAKVDTQGVSGYCGFQVGSDGTHQAILTLWDVTCTDASGRETVIRPRMRMTAPGAVTESITGDWVTGEGNFTHSLIPYNWQAGRTYRLLVQLGQVPENGNVLVLMYVYDLTSGQWTELAEYDTGMKDIWFDWGCAFLEDFSWPLDPAIRSLEVSNIRIHPRGSDSWKSLRTGTFSSCYDYRGSYAYGADADTFWCITTGLEGCWKNPASDKRFTVMNGASGQPY